MRQLSAERIHHLTNAEATITENPATVAEQGAHVAPEKASSKKGATHKKGAPKSQKAAKGGKAKASPKKAKTAQCARVPLDRRQEARPQDRVHEDQSGDRVYTKSGSRISGLPPPLARAAAFLSATRFSFSLSRSLSFQIDDR
jgi:hypothetical protein